VTLWTQDLQEADIVQRAHDYLQPAVLRKSWQDALRSFQHEGKSGFLVHRGNSTDTCQQVSPAGEATKVAVSMPDVATQHAILHPGDVRAILSSVWAFFFPFSTHVCYCIWLAL
jgi:hypothetical protein